MKIINKKSFEDNYLIVEHEGTELLNINYAYFFLTKEKIILTKNHTCYYIGNSNDKLVVNKVNKLNNDTEDHIFNANLYEEIRINLVR